MAISRALHPLVYIYFIVVSFLLEHLVSLLTLIIEIKFSLPNFLSKGTVIKRKYVKYFLTCIAVILN